MATKIDDIRTEEIKINFKSLILRTYIEAIMNMLPIFSSIIIFGTYSSINGQESLTSAKVFTVLSIFNLIAVPMRLVIMTVINFMNAQASLERVDHFFGYEERHLEDINLNDTDLQVGDILFDNCTFQWENDVVKTHFKEGEKLKPKKGAAKKEEDKEKANKGQAEKTEKKKDKKKKKAVDEREGDEIPKKKKSKKKSKKRAMNESEDMLGESLLTDKDKSSIASSSSASSASSSSSAVLDNLEIDKI